jgi:uncharacterized protein with PQ loop repeat
MAYREMLPVIVIVFSFATSSSYLLQAWAMVKNHSSRNVSFAEYLIIVLSNVLWLLYGLQIGSLTLTSTSVFSIMCSFVVVAVELKYRRKREVTISLGDKA